MKRTRVSLFKPKAKPKGRKPTVGFKAPEDIVEYLEQQKAKNWSATDVVLKHVRIGMDIEQELGSDLEAVERMADVAGISVGRMIGRLAKKAVGRKAKP